MLFLKNWILENMRQPFKPDFLPPKIAIEALFRLQPKLLEATRLLSQTDEMLRLSPISSFIVGYFSMKESVQSTKIEGTQATFTEVLEANANKTESNDIREVNNYNEALSFGTDFIKQYPITTRLFHKLHSIILNKSRGSNADMGSFRKIQNFIGSSNKIQDASYIPPEAQYINDYIKNLEEYVNNDDMDTNIPPVLKSAIIHAQFETIHPYLDGNGRLGRVLMILYLIDKGVIGNTSFFISEELERNKFKYYGLLNSLRKAEPDWYDWLDFYLDAVISLCQTKIDSLNTTEGIYKKYISFATDHKINIQVINAMFHKLIFNVGDIVSETNLSDSTVRKNIHKLLEHKLLYANDRRRNKLYYIYDVIDIFSK